MKRFLFLFSLLLTSIVSVAQDKCLQLADSIVKYQSASGGWCKNQNWLIGADAKVMKVCHDTGVGSTIDNGATMTEMRNLVKAIDRLDEMMKHGFGDVGVETMQAKRNVYNDSFVRGVEYLLKMQYDNGGFPQFYPPKLHEDYSSRSPLMTMLWWELCVCCVTLQTAQPTLRMSQYPLALELNV